MTGAAHGRLCGPCVWASLCPQTWCECGVHMYINAVSGQCHVEGIASCCKTAAASRQNVCLSSGLFILVGSYSQLVLTPATLVPPWLGTSEPGDTSWAFLHCNVLTKWHPGFLHTYSLCFLKSFWRRQAMLVTPASCLQEAGS